MTGTLMAEETVTWEECVRQAKLNNPDLVSAWEKLSQAKATKEITRSNVMPQISSDGGLTKTKSAPGSSSFTSTSSSSGRITTNYTYELTAQQLVFDGFKTSYDLSSDERDIRASRYYYDVTSSNVRLNLRTAYANLLGAQESLKVTEDIEARRKQNYELVKLRYEGGREHRGSLLTAEADVAQASYEVTEARRNIYLAQRQLTKEIGRRQFVPMIAQGDFEVKEPDTEKPEFEKLAEDTPLLRQLIEQKESARFGVNSAKAEFFPQIYTNASVGNTKNRWFPDKNQWSMGASFTLPIFEGGSRLANLDKSKALYSQYQADERSGRDGVILTLADTWTQLQDAMDLVGVQQKFLEATRERSKIAESEYSIGLLSFDNWIIIEDDFVNAKKNLLSAQVNALRAEANWIQAKGGTLDYDQR